MGHFPSWENLVNCSDIGGFASEWTLRAFQGLDMCPTGCNYFNFINEEKQCSKTAMYICNES